MLLIEGSVFSRLGNVYTAILLGSVAVNVMIRKGYVISAATIFIWFVWGIFTYEAWSANGIRDTSIHAYVILILLLNLIRNTRHLIYLSLANIIALWGLGICRNARDYYPHLDTLAPCSQRYFYYILAYIRNGLLCCHPYHNSFKIYKRRRRNFL